MDSKQGKYYHINNVDHFVETRGAVSKIPIIVIHGGPGGNNYAFQQTAGKELEKLYTVIYYDQRGCGRSSRPVNEQDYLIPTLVDDLYNIIISLEYQKVILLGYSFGGQLALEFTVIHPNLIEKAIVENPSDFYNYDLHNSLQIQGFKDVSDKQFLCKILDIENHNVNKTDVLSAIWNEAPLSIVDQFLFHNPDMGKEMRSLWMEGGFENTGLMHQALLDYPNGESILNKIQDVKAKVLIIAGENDRNCGVKLAAKIRDLLPNGKLVIMEDTAHFPDFENTPRFVDEVNKFIGMNEE